VDNFNMEAVRATYEFPPAGGSLENIYAVKGTVKLAFSYMN